MKILTPIFFFVSFSCMNKELKAQNIPGQTKKQKEASYKNYSKKINISGNLTHPGKIKPSTTPCLTNKKKYNTDHAKRISAYSGAYTLQKKKKKP